MQLHQANQACNFSFFIQNISKTPYSYASYSTIDYETGYNKEVVREMGFIRYQYRIKVIGSCNGVIALYNNDWTVYLYNPSTNESLKLPEFPRLRPPPDLLGFGYDYQANKFKVIAYGDWERYPPCSSPQYATSPQRSVSPAYSPTSPGYSSPTHSPSSPSSSSPLHHSSSLADYPSSSNYRGTSLTYPSPPLYPHPYYLVYTVGGKDHWEKKQSIPPYSFVIAKVGEHLNGVVHWVVVKPNNSDTTDIIISFDLAEDEHKEILLPNYEKRNPRKVELGVLGGCLSICTSSDLKSEAEIWIMKDYGVAESWEKVFEIPQLEIARPLCFSKMGEVFLVTDHYLFCYDPKFKTMTILKSRVQDIRTYVGSFVSLKEEDMMVTV